MLYFLPNNNSGESNAGANLLVPAIDIHTSDPDPIVQFNLSPLQQPPAAA